MKCWPFGWRYWLCLIGCCWHRKWCNGMWNHLTHVFAYSARSKLYVSQKKSSLSTVTKEEWLPRTQNASICAREYYLDRALNQTKRKHNDLMVLLSLLTACVQRVFMLLSRIIPRFLKQFFIKLILFNRISVNWGFNFSSYNTQKYQQP